jgi:hypothetical protein
MDQYSGKIYPLSRGIMRDMYGIESLRDVLPNLETFRVSVAGRGWGLRCLSGIIMGCLCRSLRYVLRGMTLGKSTWFFPTFGNDRVRAVIRGRCMISMRTEIMIVFFISDPPV